MASNRKKSPASAHKKAASAPNGARHATERLDDEVDACDFKLLEAEATPDEDLPAAEGGVA